MGARALGVQRPLASYSLPVPRRAFGEGFSAARPGRSPLQRGRVCAIDRRGPAAGGAHRAHARRDAALLRGGHPGRQAVIPELPGAWTSRRNRCCPARSCGKSNRRSARAKSPAPSGPISVRSRRTTSPRLPPSSASRPSPRRWKATWHCWRGCLQGARGERRGK